jgi:hypothetical protein
MLFSLLFSGSNFFIFFASFKLHYFKSQTQTNTEKIFKGFIQKLIIIKLLKYFAKNLKDHETKQFELFQTY